MQLPSLLCTCECMWWVKPNY